MSVDQVTRDASIRRAVFGDVFPSLRSFRRVYLGGGLNWQLQAAARACENYSGLALRRARPGGRSESTRGFRRGEPDGDPFGSESFFCSHQLWAPPGHAGRKPTPAMGANAPRTQRCFSQRRRAPSRDSEPLLKPFRFYRGIRPGITGAKIRSVTVNSN